MTPGEAVTGLSYLVGAGVFLWAARRKRLATEGMAIVAGAGFVCGILGAKLTQTLASGLPLAAAANPGGRALLGGVVFGWLGVEVAKRRLGIRRSTGDLFALALPAGEAVGRVGCHLNGCCYGARCDAPFAVWQHGALRYPAQLMSAAVAAATFAFLLWLSGEGSPKREERPEGGTVGEGVLASSACSRERAYAVQPPAPRVPPASFLAKGNPLRRLREGDLFRAYLLLFGATRFGLESVRWRESTVLGLSPMQWFCLDLIALASFGLLRRRKDDLPELRPGV